MQKQSIKNSSSSVDLDLLIAQNLVSSGNIEDAENFLRKKGEEYLSIAALDLLARIAVQNGKLDQAKQIWKSILDKDLDNEAAKFALKRLNSQWIAIAIIKRLALLASIFIVLFLSVVGLFALLNGNRQSQSDSTTVVNRLSQTRSALFPSIQGCSVYTDGGETRIVFNDGLFSRRCDLNNSANEQLAKVAHLLQDKFQSKRIIIEGYTDSSSMRKNNLYKDNYDLGFQRAATIMEIFRKQYKIKGERILITSMGDLKSPFEETNQASMLKNRTVVIRLINSMGQ
jgi:flagellar motor protein MotB